MATAEQIARDTGSGINLGGVGTGAGTGFMMGGPWGALIGGVLGAGASMLGQSPQQESLEALMKKLDDAEEYLKSTPFTKDEVMNQLLPQAQKIYRGAADVLAGKAGAAVGESGVAKGQAFGEYYSQALAPIIGAGEKQAGDAISRFGQWFSSMDSEAKNRFLSSVQTMMQATQGLEGMTDAQKGLIGGLEGASIGAGIGGEIDILGQLSKKLGLQGELGEAGAKFGNINVGGTA